MRRVIISPEDLDSTASLPESSTIYPGSSLTGESEPGDFGYVPTWDPVSSQRSRVDTLALSLSDGELKELIAPILNGTLTTDSVLGVKDPTTDSVVPVSAHELLKLWQARRIQLPEPKQESLLSKKRCLIILGIVTILLLIVIVTAILVIVLRQGQVEEQRRYILLIGGMNISKTTYSGEWTPAGTLEWFDPDSINSSIHLTDYLMQHRTNAAVGASEGRIVLAGGYNIGGPNQAMTNNTLIFDPEEGVWTRGPDMKIDRAAMAYGMVGNRLYVCGGCSVTINESLNTCEWIDIMGNGTWNSISPMSTNRTYSAAASYGHKLYVFGGDTLCYWDWLEDLNPPELYKYRTVEAYDPQSDTWTKMADMSINLTSMSTAVLGQYIFVCGGESDIVNTGKTCQRYNPETDTWSPAPPMVHARSEFAMISYDKNKIIAIGAVTDCCLNGDQTLGRTMEVYDKRFNNWTLLDDKLLDTRGRTYFVALLVDRIMPSWINFNIEN